MEKARNFPLEHYDQLMLRNTELTEEINRLHEIITKQNQEMLERDSYIYEQNKELIKEKNNVYKLSETATDVQSKSGSILKRISDSLKDVKGTLITE